MFVVSSQEIFERRVEDPSYRVPFKGVICGSVKLSNDGDGTVNVKAQGWDTTWRIIPGLVSG